MTTFHHLPAVPKKQLLALGGQLARARKSKQWRQIDVAERLGLTRQTVSRLEKGDPGVSAGYYFSVAWLLGISLFDLDQEAVLSRRKGKPINDDF